ncbi:MAG: S8 family peptidase [Bacteroidota bacterium]
MKVKTVKQVYIRAYTPYQNNDNLKGLLNPGFEVDVIEEVSGQNIDGNSIWYKDKNGDYYWSGAFDTFPGVDKEIPLESHNYNMTFRNLLPKYRNSRGRGVRIALLDTGILKNHIVLSSRKIIEKNFLPGIGDSDVDGHGTACASLINGYAKNSPVFCGTAPEAELISCKVAENRNAFSPEAVIKALEFIRQEGDIDIVNMSFQVAGKQYEQKIGNLLSAFSNSTLFIAAARNNDKLFKDYMAFPASHNAVIAVGQVTPAELKKNMNLGKNIHPGVSYLMEYMHYLTAGIESTGDMEQPFGSSYSTALVSGISALIVSEFKSRGVVAVREDVKSKLTAMSFDLTPMDLNKELKLFSL